MQSLHCSKENPITRKSKVMRTSFLGMYGTYLDLFLIPHIDQHFHHPTNTVVSTAGTRAHAQPSDPPTRGLGTLMRSPRGFGVVDVPWKKQNDPSG